MVLRYRGGENGKRIGLFYYTLFAGYMNALYLSDTAHNFQRSQLWVLNGKQANYSGYTSSEIRQKDDDDDRFLISGWVSGFVADGPQNRKHQFESGTGVNK